MAELQALIANQQGRTVLAKYRHSRLHARLQEELAEARRLGVQRSATNAKRARALELELNLSGGSTSESAVPHDYDNVLALQLAMLAGEAPSDLLTLKKRAAKPRPALQSVGESTNTAALAQSAASKPPAAASLFTASLADDRDDAPLIRGADAAMTVSSELPVQTRHRANRRARPFEWSDSPLLPIRSYALHPHAGLVESACIIPPWEQHGGRDRNYFTVDWCAATSDSVFSGLGRTLRLVLSSMPAPQPSAEVAHQMTSVAAAPQPTSAATAPQSLPAATLSAVPSAAPVAAIGTGASAAAARDGTATRLSPGGAVATSTPFVAGTGTPAAAVAAAAASAVVGSTASVMTAPAIGLSASQGRSVPSALPPARGVSASAISTAARSSNSNSTVAGGTVPGPRPITPATSASTSTTTITAPPSSVHALFEPLSRAPSWVPRRALSGYIFMADRRTLPECLSRGLLGASASALSAIRDIEPLWTHVFLYNLDTNELMGVFRATRRAALDIVPLAWKDGNPHARGFPAQLPVEWAHRFPIPLKRHILLRICGTSGGGPNHFSTQLSAQQTSRLLAELRWQNGVSDSSTPSTVGSGGKKGDSGPSGVVNVESGKGGGSGSSGSSASTAARAAAPVLPAAAPHITNTSSTSLAAAAPSAPLPTPSLPQPTRSPQPAVPATVTATATDGTAAPTREAGARQALSAAVSAPPLRPAVPASAPAGSHVDVAVVAAAAATATAPSSSEAAAAATSTSMPGTAALPPSLPGGGDDEAEGGGSSVIIEADGGEGVGEEEEELLMWLSEAEAAVHDEALRLLAAAQESESTVQPPTTQPPASTSASTTGSATSTYFGTDAGAPVSSSASFSSSSSSSSDRLLSPRVVRAIGVIDLLRTTAAVRRSLGRTSIVR